MTCSPATVKKDLQVICMRSICPECGDVAIEWNDGSTQWTEATPPRPNFFRQACEMEWHRYVSNHIEAYILLRHEMPASKLAGSSSNLWIRCQWCSQYGTLAGYFSDRFWWVGDWIGGRRPSVFTGSLAEILWNSWVIWFGRFLGMGKARNADTQRGFWSNEGLNLQSYTFKALSRNSIYNYIHHIL